MLAFLPSPLLLLINLILIPLNAITIATPIMLLGLVRLCLPLRQVTLFIERCNYYLYKAWVFNNTVIIALTNRVSWHISGDPIPQVKRSCVVISNHLSWADILILCTIYRGHIPTTKFFMKHSLIYIPFVGLACYALGMPFLRRYSSKQLIHHPELRERDIESTRAACRRLAWWPTALINFVEGTRYTPQKARLMRSPFRHLMAPKATSLAITLGEIGADIDVILNTTLCYPHNRAPGKPFIDLLRGRLREVYADIEVIPVNQSWCGDYLHDKVFKHNFTMQIRALWQRKDDYLTALLEKNHSSENTRKEEAVTATPPDDTGAADGPQPAEPLAAHAQAQAETQGATRARAPADAQDKPCPARS